MTMMAEEVRVINVASVQREFFKCHALLHPNRAEIEELCAAGVRINAIVALYPLRIEQLAEQLRDVIGDDAKAIESFCDQILAGDIEDRIDFHAALSGHDYFRFRDGGYDELIYSPAGQWWTNRASGNESKRASWTQRSVAEVLWVGAHWNELPRAWDQQEAFVNALVHLHAALTKHAADA
jgi:hypothetical protein